MKVTFNLSDKVPCFCGECDGTPQEPEKKYFECACCKRAMPYCYGASDEYYDYCDLCAYIMQGIKSETTMYLKACYEK